MQDAETDSEFRLRTAVPHDGAALWQLVRDSGVLDCNSLYAYILLCDHFADTCVVAEEDDRLVGFVTAYRPPSKPDVIFVWQIAVDASQRGKGLARRLLRALLDLPACREVHYLEATVSPDNRASRRLFESVAEHFDVPCNVSACYTREHFGSQQHGDEELFRIGPLRRGNGHI